MKKFILLFVLVALGITGFAQVPDMQTNMRYNAANNRYEVFVKPSVAAPSFYMGGSQIVIAVPHDAITNFPTYRRNAFAINSTAGGTWSITTYADKDGIPSYAGAFDYYGVDNAFGANLGILTTSAGSLLFHFNLGQNCVNGLRLWEGTGATPNLFNDPRYPTQPYGGGGDFMTNISEGLSFTETWTGNYLNTPTSLPAPVVDITYVCDVPFQGVATLDAVVTVVPTASITQYVWSGTGTYVILTPPGNVSKVFGGVPFGQYIVQVKDVNGCIAKDTLDLNANCSQPLPVELISFTASKKGDHSKLDWVTATEVNNNYFDVEHSVDGENFEKIGQVYSINGNSAKVQTYEFIHTSPLKGINYYRLMQVDYDGQFEYTDVRSVVFGNQSGLSIYPNPTSTILNVKIPLGMDQSSVVEIVSGTGQVVRSIENPDLSKSIMSLNVSDIAIGFYFVQIKTNSGNFREQFVITK